MSLRRALGLHRAHPIPQLCQHLCLRPQRRKLSEEQRDREILGEWRQHPGLGPSQIRNQLRRRGVKVSVTTAGG